MRSVLFLLVVFALITACGGEEQTGSTAPYQYGSEQGINIEQLLGNNLKSITTQSLGEGVPIDMVWAGNRCFILIQAHETDQDGLVELDPASGLTNQRFLYPLKAAAGLTWDGTNLWIMSRSTDSFLRKVDTAGNILHTIAGTGRPSGKEYGLAILNGLFWFASTENGQSTVYSFDPVGETFTAAFSMPEKIYALHARGGKLYTWQYRESFYSKYWLHVSDPDGSSHQTYSFLNDFVWGLSDKDGLLYAFCDKPDNVRLLYPFVLVPERKMVVGEPRAGDASLRYVHGSTNNNPFRLDVWAPDLRGREYRLDHQNISGFSFDQAPAEQKSDACGNGWVRYSWENRTGLVTNSFSFRLVTANAAHTPDTNASYSRDDFPTTLYDAYTKETWCFDHSSPVVAAAADSIPGSLSYMGKVMAIRKYVNDVLTIVGASGSETRASEYLAKGEGRCYAHTLCFAAIARRLGIPTRAVAGIAVASNGNILTDDPPVHTWNQVYFPDCGWVTFDIVNDDDPAGNHTLRNAAKSDHNTFAVVFTGDFDDRDFDQCFVERSWISVYSYSSLDPDKPSCVDLQELTTGWQEE